MRLIDADALDFEFDRRCFSEEDENYVRGVDEAIGVVENAPTIDPIHAAGACYCMECRYCGAPAFTEGVLLCRRGNKPERKNRDDFCSRGKLKGGENDDD